MLPRTRRASPLVVSLFAVALAITAGCSRNSSGGAGVSASLTGSSPRPTTGVRLILTELHGAFSLLLSVAPERPEDRRTLLRIDHAPNYAPRAAISPSGETVAYTMLPSGSRSPDTEAVLWLVGLQERTPRRLAERLDLRITPVWSPDNSRVVVQRVSYGGAAGIEQTLQAVDARSGVSIDLARASGTQRLFPAGFSPDGGWFYFMRYSKAGAFLEAVELRTRAGRQVARIGEGAVRDIRIAPDGSRALMLALDGDPGTYHAIGVNLANGDVTLLLPGVSRAEDVGVAWKPATPPVATVGVLGAADGAGLVMLTDGSRDVRTTAGFDVPVSWSPDGRLLFLRSFSGHSADDPGPERPVVIDAEGVRRPVTGAAPLEFVGWSDHGP